MNQLFRISIDIVKSTTVEDVVDTFFDMQDMGLTKPPFEKFAVELSAPAFRLSMEKFSAYYDTKLDHAFKSLGQNNFRVIVPFEKYPTSEDTTSNIIIIHDDGKVVDLKEKLNTALISGSINRDLYNETAESAMEFSGDIYKLLVVLLATKNLVKNTIVDKDLARGKFNKSKAYRKDYPITTTITIGQISETHTSGHGGGTVRPHLRRGHIRTQKYGPKYELSKKIFIEPVFVNADEGWIAERRAYNVKAA